MRNRPQQNGVAEQVNRTMAEGVTAMLAESGLPLSFWGEALASFVHVSNCLPTASIAMQTTPYQLWHGRKPDVAPFRVWGCLAYVHVQKDKRQSLGSHMHKCVFIGYPSGYKGWKFYDLASRRTLISERAEFDKRNFLSHKDSPPIPIPSFLDSDLHLERVPAQGGRMFDAELDTAPIAPVAPLAPDSPLVSPAPSVAPDVSPSVVSSPSPSGTSEVPPVQCSTRDRRSPGEWWKVQHREPTLMIESSEDEEEAEEDLVDDEEADEDIPGMFIAHLEP